MPDPILTPDTRVIATGRYITTAIDDGTPGEILGVVHRQGLSHTELREAALGAAPRSGSAEDEAREAAHRIAACINACRGYTTGQLTALDNRLLLLVDDHGVKALVDQREYRQLIDDLADARTENTILARRLAEALESNALEVAKHA